MAGKLVLKFYFQLMFLPFSSVLVFVRGSKEEYGISIHSLEKLAYADLTVVKELLSATSNLDTDMDPRILAENRTDGENGNKNSRFHETVYDYLRDFEASTGIDTDDKSGKPTIQKFTQDWMKAKSIEIAENPFAALKLLRRTAILLPNILRRAPKHIVFSSKLVLKKKFPDQKDIIKAMDGFINLSKYYSFQPSELVDGVLGEIQTGVELNALECFELGVRSRELKEYALSVEWLELALEKTIRENDKSTGDSKHIVQELEKSQDAHDKVYRKLLKSAGTSLNDSATPIFLQLSKTDLDWIQGECSKSGAVSTLQSAEATSNNSSATTESECHRPGRKKMPFIPSAKPQSEFIKRWRRDGGKLSKAMKFQAGICAGNNYQTENEKSRLFCRYEFRAHAIFKLSPLKIEFLSKEPDGPDVIQILDFLDDRTLKWLEKQAYKKSRPVKTKISEAKKHWSHVFGMTRVLAKKTENGLEYPPEGVKIIQKIVDATGVKIETGLSFLDEKKGLHTVSYNFAGHYAPHMDTNATDCGPKSGSFCRFATFLIYVSDTKQGGITAFPRVGMGAKPLRGSAIFWHNVDLNKNLIPNPLTLHGSCPPILSRKVIAQLWLHFPPPKISGIFHLLRDKNPNQSPNPLQNTNTKIMSKLTISAEKPPVKNQNRELALIYPDIHLLPL